MSASTRRYSVSGMSCGHCAASIKEELSTVPGVHAVDVDLSSGLVVVDGEQVPDGVIVAAVAAAGYAATPSAQG